MVKALKFSPNMLEKTLSVKIDYSDAILFLEDMRTLPRRDGLEIFDSLTKALKTKRDRRGHLTLYDLIEKLSECASEYSPIAKNAKWDRHLANIRFKCGQALTKEMFESELEAMDELKTKRKAKEESKLKAKFARYKHDVKEQIDKTKADLERAKKKDDKVKIKQHKDILKKYKTKETHIKIMEHLKIKTFKEFAEKSKSWENGEYTDKELEFFNEHLKYKKLFSKES
ncbi:MAG: hypothetical protein GWN31_09305 [Candidatus Thorarchaeota archaeon]|nr:hypothetical protein [Candidatus Thorarchaeota archaeon]NIW52216.1 hypothetical protein [Candidatus Korarchaeota archaeon]